MRIEPLTKIFYHSPAYLAYLLVLCLSFSAYCVMDWLLKCFPFDKKCSQSEI